MEIQVRSSPRLASQLNQADVDALHGGPADGAGPDAEAAVGSVGEVVEDHLGVEGLIPNDAVGIEAKAVTGGQQPCLGVAGGAAGGVDQGSGAGGGGAETADGSEGVVGAHRALRRSSELGGGCCAM